MRISIHGPAMQVHKTQAVKASAVRVLVPPFPRRRAMALPFNGRGGHAARTEAVIKRFTVTRQRMSSCHACQLQWP